MLGLHRIRQQVVEALAVVRRHLGQVSFNTTAPLSSSSAKEPSAAAKAWFSGW